MDPLSPRWNRVWGKGTHNSYHFKRDRNLDPAGEGASEQLLDQMLFEHASSFEFDIRPNIWQVGEFVVLHTDRTDFSQCNPLTECFQMLRTAHYALPDHDPVMVVVELKNTWNTIDSSFDATHTIADLDWSIRQVFGDSLYQPADFLTDCPGATTLKQCLDARDGWPTLEELRGKFVVMIMANWNKNYDNWVAYGGQGNIADRAGFPMRAIFKADGSGIPGRPGNNQGSINPVEEQRARDNSIAWQVEGGGVPYWDVMDPHRRMVVRAWQSDGIGCDTVADPLCRFWWDKGQQDGLNGQRDILGWGGNWYTTDRPWNTFDEHLPDGLVSTISGVDASRRYRDPKPYLYGSLGESRADIDPNALREFGNRLYVSATSAYFPFLYQTVPGNSSRLWETTVSLTRVGDPYGVVRPRIARERGRGCLRAAASTRDWIEICRSKDGDSGDVTVQDRTVVTVRTMRDGVLTNEPHYASTEHIDSFGALLGMSVENRGLGAIVNLYSTGRINPDGSPDWSLLTETTFPMPLDKQGVATSLDVLFVGTRVKGDDGIWAAVNRCHLPSFDDSLNPQPVAPAIVNFSWPPAGDDACIPQLLRLPAVSDRFSIVTDAAPASAGRADNLFVFAKALDGRILFNQAEPGGAFVGWQEVPGGERTDAALGAGMQANTLFVFAKRPDQRIIFNQAEPGGAFVGWREVPGGEVTDAAPASAGRADNLFVFAKALDGRILFNQAEPGGAFVGWQEVPGGERTDAALGAGMQANTLFVFAKRPDQRIIFNQAEPGGAFVGWREVPGGEVTDAAPASAGRADNLFVFAKALDGRILFNQAEPGGAFVGWQEVPGGERTDAALGAGMQANTLFVFAKRPDQRIIFNQAEPGGAFVGWL